MRGSLDSGQLTHPLDLLLEGLGAGHGRDELVLLQPGGVRLRQVLALVQEHEEADGGRRVELLERLVVQEQDESLARQEVVLGDGAQEEGVGQLQEGGQPLSGLPGGRREHQVLAVVADGYPEGVRRELLVLHPEQPVDHALQGADDLLGLEQEREPVDELPEDLLGDLRLLGVLAGQVLGQDDDLLLQQPRLVVGVGEGLQPVHVEVEDVFGRFGEELEEPGGRLPPGHELVVEVQEQGFRGGHEGQVLQEVGTVVAEALDLGDEDEHDGHVVGVVAVLVGGGGLGEVELAGGQFVHQLLGALALLAGGGGDQVELHQVDVASLVGLQEGGHPGQAAEDDPRRLRHG